MTPAERDKVAREEQVIVNCFHRVFQSDDGQTILGWLTGYFRLDAPAFVTHRDRPMDPYEGAYRSGQHSILCEINQMLRRPSIGDDDAPPKMTVIR